ncbi:NDP-sugar synthase [Acidiferrimicrobium sp. IK]|uniref:NDP-sugar synthase n=1 Tax=Acidiferrimicrobium sp. IK TaxID=2871700 RepID=UPI0021CB85C7|nr:NDP-sugar synthase [Acidiferrimicrobium sp. IK]MCU4185703.1 NDP-sugar synthase [Acidiferrimicrobium sp. IK]
MRAVVLVGGKGTRLRPLTLATPKQMLPVAGRPMIEWVLEHLSAHGITDVVLSLGYRPDVFVEAYPDGRCGGVSLHYAVEDEPLDTAGAIAFAARGAGIDETFVVVNGDVLTGLDVTALIAFHRARRAAATIALTPVEDPSRYGVVPTDADGRVTAFIEKPPADQAPTNLINAGTYVLEPSVLDRIAPGGPVSIERTTFPALVEERTLFAMASDAPWVDAGTPATYLQVNLDRAGETPIDPTAAVDASAQVTASVVGAAARIGSAAVVSRSVLLEGATVGAGATVRDSIIGWRAHVGPGATVSGGSILGESVAVAAGETVTSRLVPAPAP